MSEIIATGPKSGRMAACRADGDDVAWYPMSAMRWARTPVIVALGARDGEGGVVRGRGGYEVLALIDRHETRRGLWWWYQLGAWSDDDNRWLPQTRVPLEMVGRDPPTALSPAAWRPVDPDAWQHPLPAPLDPALGPNHPAPPRREAPEPIDPHLASDGWPFPGLPLGDGTPASRAECEARVLRAFRTSASRVGGGVGHRRLDTCADIPREIIDASCRRNAAWWSVHADADGGAYEAVRSGWTPTRRDMADWDRVLSWLNGLASQKIRIVALRAADPPWSFRQIAEKLRMKSHNTVRRAYAEAIAWAYETARREGREA